MATSHHAHARRLADAAGERLLALRAANAHHADPAALKREGDAASQATLAALLSDGFAGDAVLSEEAHDDLVRLAAERVWIIDPLDGTREFSEVPRDDWAVHVALWEHGELVAGAVALPARSVTYSTSGSNQSVPGRPAGVALRLAVSRSRPPAFVTHLAKRLQGRLVPMGSAGVKAMSVVAGATDAYVHAGGQYEWDSAAPVAVARSYGLHCSRVDGSPLRYNQENPWLPDLLVCRPELAGDLLSAIAEAGPDQA